MNDAAKILSNKLQDDQISPTGTNWSRWPGGWKNEIGTALIDAVYSARAVYKTRYQNGIHAHVTHWQDGYPNSRDSLPSLIDDINAAGALQWAKSFGNSQHSPGRSRRRPECPWKSAAVLEAALELTNREICTSSDIAEASRQQVERALRTVPGIGEATTTYFMMLLGFRGVKADIMIRRYVGRAINKASSATTHTSIAAVTAVANSHGWCVLDLEHSIWAFERRK